MITKNEKADEDFNLVLQTIHDIGEGKENPAQLNTETFLARVLKESSGELDINSEDEEKIDMYTSNIQHFVVSSEMNNINEPKNADKKFESKPTAVSQEEIKVEKIELNENKDKEVKKEESKQSDEKPIEIYSEIKPKTLNNEELSLILEKPESNFFSKSIAGSKKSEVASNNFLIEENRVAIPSNVFTLKFPV